MSPAKWRVRHRLTSFGVEWMVHAPNCFRDSGYRCKIFSDHGAALAYAFRQVRPEPPC